MAAGFDLDHLAFALEIAVGAEPFGEILIGVEDEILVAEQLDQEREVMHRGQPRALRARAIEMLIFRVERDREQRVRPPFEGMLLAVRRFDLGRAVPVQYIDDFLVQMMHLVRFRAGQKLEAEDRDKIVAPFHKAHRAVHAVPVPEGGLDGRHVHAEILIDRHRLRLAPGEVAVMQKYGVPGGVAGLIGHRSFLCSRCVTRAIYERASSGSNGGRGPLFTPVRSAPTPWRKFPVYRVRRVLPPPWRF